MTAELLIPKEVVLKGGARTPTPRTPLLSAMMASLPENDFLTFPVIVPLSFIPVAKVCLSAGETLIFRSRAHMNVFDSAEGSSVTTVPATRPALLIPAGTGRVYPAGD